MKLDFKKNVKRNMVANAASSGIRLLFPFLNRTLFLWLLGPAYLGLNGLFGSILGVLMLAELGFGTAVVCSMYKPVADDDRELLCAYLKVFRVEVRRHRRILADHYLVRIFAGQPFAAIAYEHTVSISPADPIGLYGVV